MNWAHPDTAGMFVPALSRLPQVLEREEVKNQQPDAILRQVAAVGIELPGLDSNQDKENQNLNTPFRKSHKSKNIEAQPTNRCTAGRTRSEKPQPEGGILDADLAALVAAWPTLPDPIKAAILAMVRVAGGWRG